MNTQQVRAADLPAQQRMILMRRAQDALKRDPNNLEIMLTVAGLHAADGNSEAALDLLQRALSKRKKNPEILRRLVSVSKEVRLFKLARKYARKLCEVEPRNAENFRTYGRILEISGAPLQAATALEKANLLDPGDADTLSAIGRCHSNLGDPEQARHYYAKALELDPEHTMALYGLATAKKFDSGEADSFATAAVKAAQDEPDAVTKSLLLFAAGKTMDDCRRYDEAFDFFVQANRLRLPETGDRNYMNPIRNAIEVMTRDFFATRHNTGLPTTRPIFVLGMPRSGTTLTESICAAHSQVTAGDELDLMTTACKSLSNYSPEPAVFRRNLVSLSPEAIREGAQGYLDRAEVLVGKVPHFTDKMPHNFLNIGMIRLFFPNARIIHVRRHPLDNCLSLFSNSMRQFHNDYKSDLKSLGLYYLQYL
ncbi:MAG: sulfotransferase, partial [Pseudomonadota bacterium]|nr:sulfotransferase [Pseudomonadota bacterium]